MQTAQKEPLSTFTKSAIFGIPYIGEKYKSWLYKITPTDNSPQTNDASLVAETAQIDFTTIKVNDTPPPIAIPPMLKP